MLPDGAEYVSLANWTVRRLFSFYPDIRSVFLKINNEH